MNFNDNYYCKYPYLNQLRYIGGILLFYYFLCPAKCNAQALWSTSITLSQQATGAQICSGSCATCATVTNLAWTTGVSASLNCGASAFLTMTSGNQSQTKLLTSEGAFSPVADNIPAGATINGVEVCIQASSAIPGVTLQNIQLMNGAATIGAIRGPSAILTGALTYYTFGGYGDMWGLTTATLDPALINSANFGLGLTANDICCPLCPVSTGLVHVDCVQITVYYNGSSGPPTRAGGAGGAFGCASVLPVQLLTFTAKPSGEQVDIEWITASQTNNALFTIERSVDGENWGKVSTVPGAGNSDQTLTYNSTDKNPVSGTSYYRLVQTDYDGSSTYSSTVPVNFTLPEGQMLLYPNPATSKLYCNLPAGSAGIQAIRIIDVTGRVVLNTQVMVPENGHVELNTANLQSGIYMVEANNGIGLVTRKSFIKR